MSSSDPYLACFTVPTFADTQSQTDELVLLDDDDTMDADDPDDEICGMEIPDGFRIQQSKPATLDSSLLQRGVLIRLGMGWFGALITRQSQLRTRHLYDYRVQLELDQSRRSMKLPLDKYSADPDAGVGSWVLLERTTAEQVAGVGAANTLGVSRAGRTLRANVTRVDQEG